MYSFNDAAVHLESTTCSEIVVEDHAYSAIQIVVSVCVCKI